MKLGAEWRREVEREWEIEEAVEGGMGRESGEG